MLVIYDVWMMMYDIIVFENLGFRPSTRTRQSGVFKNLHSEDRFRKPAFFGGRKGRSYVKAKTEGKNLRFQKPWIRVECA